MKILSKTYYGEDLCDVERDVSESLESASGIPGDEHGFPVGEFLVDITWSECGNRPAPELPEGVTRKDRAGVIDYALTGTGVNRVTVLKNRSLENIQLHIDCLTYEKHLRENED